MTLGTGRKVAWIALTFALSLASVLLQFRFADAMDIAAKGDTIFLGGTIKPGDAIGFKSFISAAPKGTYHNVFLASGGGFIVEAIEIGRTIHEQRLTTIVDAGKALCASACTAIFISGTNRIYLNSSSLQDGGNGKGPRGLGFHNGSAAASLASDHYSGQASALMIDAYYEFGCPRAAEVITKASPNGIFILSGKTALELGIATSLGKS
jgi:hypothetical protein